MGRPKKNAIQPTTATRKLIVAEKAPEVTVRPVRFLQVTIVHKKHRVEQHLFNENGVEYVVKEGGEK